MKVILKKEVPSLGYEGDVVTVKDGYARNYLIPNKIVVRFTKAGMDIVEKAKAEYEKIAKEKNNVYQVTLDKLNEIKTIDLEMLTKETGKLFGSVTSRKIAEILSEKTQVDISKKQIILKQIINEAGTYDVLVYLTKDFKTNIKVNVNIQS